jgi:nucleoside-diphosphate-sugar epimerase
MKAIAVTGASGFVGKALCDALDHRNFPVVRLLHSGVAPGAITVGDIDATTDWMAPLATCGTVLHLAARVHVMQDAALNPLNEYRRTNVQGTLRLGRQAAALGVRRFVFISSIKVNGESTAPGQCFGADDVPGPQDPYGISKMEAEQGLRVIAQRTGMEVVIVRPPLVYGPGVKANFASLMRAVKKGVPLPMGAIHNQRSLIGIDNLVDFLITCIAHPLAANETFLVSDGHDVSVPELVRGLAGAMGVKAHLLPIPVSVLQIGASMLGKRDAVNRLCENLQVDIDKARKLLAWTPPISIYEGLRRAVQGL